MKLSTDKTDFISEQNFFCRDMITHDIGLQEAMLMSISTIISSEAIKCYKAQPKRTVELQSNCGYYLYNLYGAETATNDVLLSGLWFFFNTYFWFP